MTTRFHVKPLTEGERNFLLAMLNAAKRGEPVSIDHKARVYNTLRLKIDTAERVREPGT